MAPLSPRDVPPLLAIEQYLPARSDTAGHMFDMLAHQRSAPIAVPLVARQQSRVEPPLRDQVGERVRCERGEGAGTTYDDGVVPTRGFAMDRSIIIGTRRITAPMTGVDVPTQTPIFPVSSGDDHVPLSPDDHTKDLGGSAGRSFDILLYRQLSQISMCFSIIDRRPDHANVCPFML